MAGRRQAIETEWMKITPKLATDMLTKNEVNRRLRPRQVASYAEDMRLGLWAETGEAIKFSNTGALLDGQHRLAAIIESRTALFQLVVTGLPDKAQGNMDQGAARTAGQALAMGSGVKNATLTGGVARWFLVAGEPGPHMETAIKSKTSTPRILKAVADNPDIEVAASKYSSLQAALPGSPTAICYTWLWLHRIDPVACQDFFYTGLVDMNFHAPHDPRKATLRALQRLSRDDGYGASSQAKAVVTVSVLTRGWNAWRQGEELDSLALKKGGSDSRIIPPVKPI